VETAANREAPWSVRSPIVISKGDRRGARTDKQNAQANTDDATRSLVALSVLDRLGTITPSGRSGYSNDDAFFEKRKGIS
jgi:hypothetical protein